VIETGQLSIVHGMVRSGVGVALLPRLAASGAEHVVRVSDPQARRELGVVWRRTALESPPGGRVPRPAPRGGGAGAADQHVLRASRMRLCPRLT
jgi:hypothetical protein